MEKYVEVAPGIFLTEEDHKGNMAYDEWRDNEHQHGLQDS